jgi:hypothetical protein
VAGQVYGEGSGEQQAVRDGWSEVGIKVAGARSVQRRVRRRVEAAAEQFDGQLDQLRKQLEKTLLAAIDRKMQSIAQ